jgi:hypothetical protein
VYSLALAVLCCDWHQIPMTTRRKAGLPTYLREICGLVESTDDHDRPVFVVSRWAMCKQLDSLSAVEPWLMRVTGNPLEVA